MAELEQEIREALEEIVETAAWDSEKDTPVVLREKLDTIKSLAGQALADIDR